ncbi:hypothetical protein ACFX13_025091 [Malus domestica]
MDLGKKLVPHRCLYPVASSPFLLGSLNRNCNACLNCYRFRSWSSSSSLDLGCKTPSQKKKTSNFPSSLESLGDLPSVVDTPQRTISSVLYDPIFHLNLLSQPPLFRELLQSLPHGYTLPGSGNGSLLSSDGDEREKSEGEVLYDPDADESLGR